MCPLFVISSAGATRRSREISRLKISLFRDQTAAPVEMTLLALRVRNRRDTLLGAKSLYCLEM